MENKFLLVVLCFSWIGSAECGFSVFKKNNDAPFNEKAKVSPVINERIPEKNFGDYNLAVVDIKKIAAYSEAGKNIEIRIADINNESKKDLLELESKIKAMEESKNSDVDARRAIDDMLVVLYDRVRTERFRIAEAYKDAVNKLEKEIKRVVSEVAREKNLKLVVISDAVVYFGNDCPDITDEIIVRMNQECPEIKVELGKMSEDGQ